MEMTDLAPALKELVIQSETQRSQSTIFTIKIAKERHKQYYRNTWKKQLAVAVR